MIPLSIDLKYITFKTEAAVSEMRSAKAQLAEKAQIWNHWGYLFKAVLNLLAKTNLWVFIKLFPDFWHWFGMEGSGEVSENTKHKGLVHAINHPMPAHPVIYVLPLPHSLIEKGLRGRAIVHCSRGSLRGHQNLALQTRLVWGLPSLLLDWTG